MSENQARGAAGPLVVLARRQERARRRMSPWQTGERGPFDLVGDVHGCADTLRTLLDRLGYASEDGCAYRHPQGRRLLMLGDYINRGPASQIVLEIVRRTVLDGAALALAGNHEEALLRALDESGLPPGTGARVENEQGVWPLGVETMEWLAALPAHLVVDGETLVAVHAGIAAADVGALSARVQRDAQWGPEDPQWWRSHDVRGPTVVYGHWIERDGPVRQGATIGLDCGCGAPGGRLAAYRHPEDETVVVEMEPEDAAHVARTGEPQ